MSLHHDEEGIVSDQLLGEHSVIASVVIGREGLTGMLDVVSLGSLRLDVGGDLSNTFVTGHTSTASGSWLERQDSF